MRQNSPSKSTELEACPETLPSPPQKKIQIFSFRKDSSVFEEALERTLLVSTPKKVTKIGMHKLLTSSQASHQGAIISNVNENIHLSRLFSGSSLNTEVTKADLIASQSDSSRGGLASKIPELIGRPSAPLTAGQWQFILHLLALLDIRDWHPDDYLHKMLARIAQLKAIRPCAHCRSSLGSTRYRS
jgi:hypothetical protein